MTLNKYLEANLNISKRDAKKIASLVKKYEKDPNMSKKKLNIRVPSYTLSEELFNSISHGVGALLSIAALVLLVIKAETALAKTAVSLFGSTMILLYTMSTVYHALSPHVEGKKILRILDHCNVFLLVLGTYIPIALLGVKGPLGWLLFSVVTSMTILGITLTSINIDKFQIQEVICHLINGWSILIGVPKLLQVMGPKGVAFLVLGGIMYTLGSILYGIGTHKKYMHSIFHLFCLLGTFFHFYAIYFFLL